jgi:hypothetical protein
LMGFLRARYDELTDTGREHRDRWTANPKLSQLPTLLRIHPPGQCTRAFCAYLKETIFPEWKQIERKSLINSIDNDSGTDQSVGRQKASVGRQKASARRKKRSFRR